MYMDMAREEEIARQRQWADGLNNSLEAWKQQVLDELHERDGPVLLKSKKMVNLTEYSEVEAVLNRIQGENLLSVVCDITDATDVGGDGCDWYHDNPSACGNYDTEWFTAS
jgi:hypothetical protein